MKKQVLYSFHYAWHIVCKVKIIIDQIDIKTTTSLLEKGSMEKEK